MASIVLLSGGKDSVECLELALKDGPVHCLTFDYGQDCEIDMARDAVEDTPATWEVVTVPLHAIRTNGRVSDLRPGRNLIFLAYALGHAEQYGYDEIWIGAQAEDQGLYPDCSPEFLAAFEKVASISAERPIRIRSLLERDPADWSWKPGL